MEHHIMQWRPRETKRSTRRPQTRWSDDIQGRRKTGYRLRKIVKYEVTWKRSIPRSEFLQADEGQDIYVFVFPNNSTGD